MSNFAALVQNENMKIYRRARTWIMFGLILVANIVAAILMHRFSPDDYAATHNMLDFMMVARSMMFLSGVFTVVIAGDIVASEFGWGTVKLLLIRPVKRWKILLSKYVATLLFALCLIVFQLIVSALVGGITFGFGGETQVEGAGILFREYGFDCVDLLITATFSFMISTVFRSSALAISLALVIMFIGNSIATALMAMKVEWAKYLLFTNMDLSIYFRDSSFIPLLPGMSLGFSVAVLAAYFVLFHIISFWVFLKRDVAA